jgi:L-threonylcarbamoyladenylate synthase
LPKVERFAPDANTGLLSNEAVSRIVYGLRNHGVAILPTETGYLLGVDVSSRVALAKAFAIKGRKRRSVMHVACSTLEMVKSVANVNPRGLRLLGKFTPGPVSVIMNKNSTLFDDLVTLDGTVGIRIPSNVATLQIITSLGRPITATSVNTSGMAPIDPQDDRSLASLNWGSKWPSAEMVSVVADVGRVHYDRPSVLVRVVGPETEILREGPVSNSDIEHVASTAGFIETIDWT